MVYPQKTWLVFWVFAGVSQPVSLSAAWCNKPRRRPTVDMACGRPL